MQVKSTSYAQSTLPQPDSKRQRIEGEESNDGITAESKQLLSVVEKYTAEEMRLYLVSSHQRNDCKHSIVIVIRSFGFSNWIIL